MVMINNKFIGKSNERMLPWKLQKCQILPVNQNLTSVYFSLAKFQLVSCMPFSCHDLANDMYSQTATLI